MKKIKTGREAREAIREGINLSESIIRSTLGPNGKNSLIGRIGMVPFITNDGATVALEIEHEDEFINAGCDVIKELTQIASIRVKGATTTATVLFKAILDEAFKRIDEKSSIIEDKINVIAVKKEIQSSCDIVCRLIEEESKPITTEQIYDVALTAGEFEWIAKICQDVISQIGVNGYISIVDGPKTEYEVFKGMELKAGYHSDLFINNDRKCILESPLILVHDDKLLYKDISDFLRIHDNENIICVAPDFDSQLIPVLEEVRKKNNRNFIILRLPTYGKKDILDDIKIFIGESGVITRAVISASNTFFIGGKGNTSERVFEIQTMRSETESALDKEIYDQRIANLTGGVSVIKIGAESDFERAYFKKKMEDAINASQKALAKGVIRGGGITLLDVSNSTKAPRNILSFPISVPYHIIQESFGEPTEISASIIDSTQITIEILRLVCSIASTFITLGSAIVVKKEKENDIA